MLVLDNAQLPYLEAHSTICVLSHTASNRSLFDYEGVTVWYC